MAWFENAVVQVPLLLLALSGTGARFVSAELVCTQNLSKSLPVIVHQAECCPSFSPQRTEFGWPMPRSNCRLRVFQLHRLLLGSLHVAAGWDSDSFAV